ncbi:hypothetical protein KPP03845_104548 [Streptomyces xanthophaeus]|uniref:DUF6193 family natural product biosynthesis protein n=1 Tax=Streptomyces xanthophaeus TaxID=67385 RepID=UPI00233E953C|nr:DUF6193 family natural product biosynthesis protein [Streptomyces xanthophaeus]WCD88143.1 hypothetical protein KPP03845_104548 [Streptomyces xanthophaeus]
MPDLDAARLRGPAEAVAVRWEQLVLAARWMRERHALRRPGRPYPPLVPLLEAARADPVLGRLYPVTSHYAVSFSTLTRMPYDVRLPSVEPLADGRYRLRGPRHLGAGVTGHATTPHEALAAVAAAAPPDHDPTVT